MIEEAFGPVRHAQQEKKAVELSIDGQVFQGNNQATLLEQAENAGIAMDYSCRAGFCGACKVTLVSGDVEQPDVPALSQQDREQGKVLACCCVPKNDLTIIK
ncbi:2Fe-2S iron-sulfur cluster-binding protein (plasmid) [Photobacterium leiognathi subsp. mandapamensis]